MHALGSADILRLSNVPRVEHTRIQSDWSIAMGSCRVLMIYPRFVPNSFWNYAETCQIMGARYPAAPLGLITVAALLPRPWEVRLVNRNTEELTDADLDWADLVMVGGMLNQQPDFLYLIELAHSHGKPVCVGGSDVSSSPHLYAEADFRVIGEAEHIMADFVLAWERGERSGVFTAEKFNIDVTQSPLPRFDLLKFEHYLYIGVQYSRGCPFTCEFCDIIELYGRVPRTKTNAQILSELQALYDLGYRGHVDFVDDNLIGNKKNLRAFMPELRVWQETHNYPFEFSTEASINLADDDELLQAMKDSNFVTVFVGIESPDPDTLVQTRKKQNTRRNIPECVHKIYSYGMVVTAGFIIGFDSERGSVAASIIECIEECAIPVCMVGLLYALPGTQLTRRLAKEGRLPPGYEVMRFDRTGDQCTLGCNFETKRPLREILDDYRTVLENVFDPIAYAGRLSRLAAMLNRSASPLGVHKTSARANLDSIGIAHRIINMLPEGGEPFRATFNQVARSNPAVLRYIIFLMAMFVHLGPFSRDVIDEINRRMVELDGRVPIPAVAAASEDAAVM